MAYTNKHKPKPGFEPESAGLMNQVREVLRYPYKGNSSVFA